jgi:hypothetical protein
MSNPRALNAPILAKGAFRAVFAVLLAGLWSLALPSAAQASLLSPEAEDAMATYIAIFALIFVPVALIALFWMVHVLPEKIAHKRHHPQFEAIKTLCLLSLVFGGLLWPIAWLWAYTKPTGYKMAYGTDKHSDYYADPTVNEREALAELQQRAAFLSKRGPTASDLESMRADLAALESRITASRSGGEDR